MRQIISLPALFILLITSCTVQKPILLPSVSERFDIVEFNKHAAYDYWKVLENDSLRIGRLFSSSDKTYLEVVKYKNKYTSCAALYSDKGIIKQLSYTYEPGGIKIGIWEYYDSTGWLIRKEDWDKKYKVGYQRTISIAKSYYGFSQKDFSIELVGEEWYLVNFRGPNSGNAIAVNIKNGKYRKFKVYETY